MTKIKGKQTDQGLPGKWPLKWCVGACNILRRFINLADFFTVNSD